MRKIGIKKLGKYTIAVVFSNGDDEISIPYPYMDLIKEYAEIGDVTLPNKGVDVSWFDEVLDYDLKYEEN
jgi:hypothetical protein